MPGIVEICQLPTPASAPTPTYAINSRIPERNSVYQERVRRHSTASRTPKYGAPGYVMIISQSPSPAQSAAANSPPILDQVVVKPRFDGTEVRYSSGRRNSLIRPKKQLVPSSSSGDEGSGSDTASEAGSS